MMKEGNNQVEINALSKSIYYLNYAKQYADDFRRDCRMEARRNASLWVTKISSVLNDIYSSLTPAARERFIEEISANPDPIFMEAISSKFLQLNTEQRALVETMIDGMLAGETVQFEKIPEP